MTDNVCNVLILGPESAGKSVLLNLLYPAVVQELSRNPNAPFQIRFPDTGPGVEEAIRLANESKGEIRFGQSEKSGEAHRKAVDMGLKVLNGMPMEQTGHFSSFVMSFKSRSTTRDVVLVDHPGGTVFFERKTPLQAKTGNDDLQTKVEEQIDRLCSFASRCESLLICYPLLTTGNDNKAQKQLLGVPDDRIIRLVDACQKLKRIVIAFTKAEANTDVLNLISSGTFPELSNATRILMQSQRTELEDFVNRVRGFFSQIQPHPNLFYAAVSALGIVELPSKRIRPNYDLGRDRMRLYTSRDSGMDYSRLRWRALNLWEVFFKAAFDREVDGVLPFPDETCTSHNEGIEK